MRTPEFWLKYLFVTEPDDPPAPWVPWDPWDVELPLATRASLSLSVDQYDYISLRLREPGADCAVEIAWDDLAHWHPHVLRWSEMDAICRRVAALNSEYPHPGVSMLLLYRFAPIVSAADADFALPMLKAGLQRLGPFSSPDRARIIALCDLRGEGVRWREIPPFGWCIEQSVQDAPSGLYSLRSEGNENFPWKGWRTFIAELAGES